MGELFTALAVVLSINALMVLAQISVIAMNPAAAQFYNCQGDLLGLMDANDCQAATYAMNDTNPTSFLPSQGGEIQIDSGAAYTDTSASANTWLSGGKGLNYLNTIVSTPKNMLVAIGVPGPFAFVVGTLWYLLTVFLIVGFVLGRNA